jgi:hypothetical protein
MDGESTESDEAVMDVEPQPCTAMHGRRNQDQQQNGVSPPTVLFGMVAGMARDAYCAQGSLTLRLWPVRAANCMMNQY